MGHWEYGRIKCRLHNDVPALQASMGSAYYEKYCPGIVYAKSFN